MVEINQSIKWSRKKEEKIKETEKGKRMYLGNLKSAMSTIFLQYFYNKSQVISYYWFKFNFSTEITFLTQQ